MAWDGKIIHATVDEMTKGITAVCAAYGIEELRISDAALDSGGEDIDDVFRRFVASRPEGEIFGPIYMVQYDGERPYAELSAAFRPN